MGMKEIYRIGLGIFFLVLILAFVVALYSQIVFASMVQQEEIVLNETNPTELIIDQSYNKKNNYVAIDRYPGFEFDRKSAVDSFETLQNESSWIEMSFLVEDSYSDSQQSELNRKRQGFMGLYHPFKGKVYAGTNINEDEDLYQAYLFGVNAILNKPAYGEYPFKENIENHCQEFDTNLVYGIILPPSERGVVNNPNDTKLWEPASYPGMIQAANRFSRLSKIFPQIRGVIIDDFWANYGTTITQEDMENIKGALSGKNMNLDGTVDLGSPPTTPNLKMFVVTYGSEISPHDEKIMDLIDGVNFWLYNQDDSYNNFDQYLNTILANYPNKELIIGVYVHNSDYGDMSNQSISYLIDEGIKLYDKGLSPGILLFAGHWLVKNYITRERSQMIGLSDILYSKYYPYLGEINCQVLDDETLQPLQGAKIMISPNTTRKITAAGKTTNEQGLFRFSGYAWRPGGISYSFIVDKEGYDPYKGSFTLEANRTINLPPVNLKQTDWIRSRLTEFSITYEHQF